MSQLVFKLLFISSGIRIFYSLFVHRTNIYSNSRLSFGNTTSVESSKGETIGNNVLFLFLLIGWLSGFYGISTTMDYLMPNPVPIY